MAENEVITFGAAFDPSGVARGVTIANQKLNELSQSAKRNEAAFASASLSTSRFSEKGVATLRALSGESKKTSTAFQQLAAAGRFRGGPDWLRGPRHRVERGPTERHWDADPGYRADGY